MIFSPDVRTELRRITRSADPEEACGLIYWRGRIPAPRITRAIPCPNRAANPLAGFRLTETDRVAALKATPPQRGDKIGYFHTHPFAPPLASAADLRGMAGRSGLHVILDWDAEWALYWSRTGRVRALSLFEG